MSTKSTRSFCQKLVWQKNSGGSYINVSEKNAYRSAVMFIYRKKCLLIKMSGVTLYTAEDDDFAINKILHD